MMGASALRGCIVSSPGKGQTWLTPKSWWNRSSSMEEMEDRVGSENLGKSSDNLHPAKVKTDMEDRDSGRLEEHKCREDAA